MPSLVSMIGQSFGRLTVLERGGTYRKKIKYRCRCVCGNEVIVLGACLRRGHTKSCGCFKRELRTQLRHGHGTHAGRSGTYQTWIGMRGRRCGFEPRWSVFENFLADMGERPSGTTLDRIENSLGYSKANCRWATGIQQGRNRTITRKVTFGGVTKPLAQWAEELGLKYHTLLMRLRRKRMSLEEAMTPAK